MGLFDSFKDAAKSVANTAASTAKSAVESFEDTVGYEDKKLTEAEIAALPYISADKTVLYLRIILNNKAAEDVIEDSDEFSDQIEELVSHTPAAVLAPFIDLAFSMCREKVEEVNCGRGVNLDIPWPMLPAMTGAAPVVALIKTQLVSN